MSRYKQDDTGYCRYDRKNDQLITVINDTDTEILNHTIHRNKTLREGSQKDSGCISLSNWRNTIFWNSSSINITTTIPSQQTVPLSSSSIKLRQRHTHTQKLNKA